MSSGKNITLNMFLQLTRVYIYNTLSVGVALSFTIAAELQGLGFRLSSPGSCLLLKVY